MIGRPRREIIGSVYPGSCWDITNHYVTERRPDHPCAGTTRRVVSECNGSAFYTVLHPTLVGHHAKGSRVEWPNAGQLERDDDGTIRLYGGGAGQAIDELFLTLTPAAVALPFCLKCKDCGEVIRWVETGEEGAGGGYCDACAVAEGGSSGYRRMFESSGHRLARPISGQLALEFVRA